MSVVSLSLALDHGHLSIVSTTNATLHQIGTERPDSRAMIAFITRNTVLDSFPDVFFSP